MRLLLRPSPPDLQSFEPDLRAARAGDLPAYNRLVLEHQDVLYNLAYRVLGDQAAAVEATQAAFVSAQRKLRAYRTGPFRVWLIYWLVRACRSHLDGKVSRPVASDLVGPGDLAKLPPAQRLALVLVDIAGLDYGQAASVLEQAPAQVRHDLAAARRALVDARAPRPF